MPFFNDAQRSAAIGARLLIARVTAGLTRPQLGSKLGLSERQVEKYELGRTRLPAVMLEDLGEVLGRPTLFFIETDHEAIARTLLLQLPAHRVRRRQIDRAVATLKGIVRSADRSATAPASADHPVSA